MTTEKNPTVDGLHVIEEYLLTKGEHIVHKDMSLHFKPLIEFAIVVYGLKATSTSKLAMKFDLEKFFMRNGLASFDGHDVDFVKVPQDLYDRVKRINDQYRSAQQAETNITSN